MKLPNDIECPKCSQKSFGARMTDSDLHAIRRAFPREIYKCGECGYVGEKEYQEFLNTIVCPHCKDNIPSIIHTGNARDFDIYYSRTCIDGCGKRSLVCRCGWLAPELVGENGFSYVIDNKCPNCNYQFYYS
jgi:hypothetical protein